MLCFSCGRLKLRPREVAGPPAARDALEVPRDVVHDHESPLVVARPVSDPVPCTPWIYDIAGLGIRVDGALRDTAVALGHELVGA